MIIFQSIILLAYCYIDAYRPIPFVSVILIFIYLKLFWVVESARFMSETFFFFSFFKTYLWWLILLVLFLVTYCMIVRSYSTLLIFGMSYEPNIACDSHGIINQMIQVFDKNLQHTRTPLLTILNLV